MPDTQLWSNSVAQDGWFHETGNVKSGLVVGVMSCSVQHITTYDLTNYRDEFEPLNASLYGVDPLGGGIITLADEIVAHYDQSDLFTHTEPRPEEKNRTMLKFWSGSNGAGNVLYSVWADKFVSFEVSATAPTYI